MSDPLVGVRTAPHVQYPTGDISQGRSLGADSQGTAAGTQSGREPRSPGVEPGPREHRAEAHSLLFSPEGLVSLRR